VITNSSIYALWKARAAASETLTLEDKYRILEGLYDEARRLGAFGKSDLMLGLQADIRLAAALNANVSDPSR
jgi:hypothetical protein